MKEKKKLYFLIALLLLLLLVYVWNRPSAPGSGILASNPRFQPLSVQDPQLRMDLIAKIRATTYSGTHRNIFSAMPPPPPPPTAAELKAKAASATSAGEYRACAARDSRDIFRLRG